MKSFYLQLSNVMIVLLLIAGCTDPQNPQTEELEMLKQKNAALNELAAPPPASMDNLYPPKAEGPVYLMEMFKLSTPFTGITVDLFGNDFENVLANFESFKTQYVEISKMVPEWEQKFPIDVVETLGSALETKDPGKIMEAYEGVGKICYECHASFMAKVQLRYYWKEFNAIKILDPLTKEEVGFSQFKHFLSGAFTGIGIDLHQGQIENAQKQFQAFNARFQVLKEICKECHQTERKYYVDESIQVMIDKLGEALNEPDIDMEMVGKLSQGVGMMSCLPCHHVHIPSIGAKFNWDLYEKIGK